MEQPGVQHSIANRYGAMGAYVGFRVYEFSGLRFRVLGFKVSGFRVLCPLQHTYQR